MLVDIIVCCEWFYSESIDQLFLAAPFMEYFNGENLLVAHSALQELYNAITSNVPDGLNPKGCIFPDDITEVEWRIKRNDMPDWTVVWSLISRSKLRADVIARTKELQIAPEPRCDVTEYIPGAIVYCLSNLEVNPDFVVPLLMKERYVQHGLR